MKKNILVFLIVATISLSLVYAFFEIIRIKNLERDQAYKTGVYDGGLYTFYNKDGVMPSMWRRDYMLKLYKEKVGWQNDSDIDAFWRNITTRNFGMEIEPQVTPR